MQLGPYESWCFFFYFSETRAGADCFRHWEDINCLFLRSQRGICSRLQIQSGLSGWREFWGTIFKQIKSATRQVSQFPLSWKKRCETSPEIDMLSAKKRRWSNLFGSLLILGYLWEADNWEIRSCCRQDHIKTCFTLFFWTRQCIIPHQFPMKRRQKRPPDQSIKFQLWTHSAQWPELLLVEVNWSR